MQKSLKRKRNGSSTEIIKVGSIDYNFWKNIQIGFHTPIHSCPWNTPHSSYKKSLNNLDLKIYK